MLQHRLCADVSQVKVQDIPLERYIWRNTNFRSINKRIDFGQRDLIDMDVMSHLF